jgi:hypothetical protein
MLVAARRATDEYVWGNRSLWFVSCGKCGCVTHWQPVEPRESVRLGVNARHFESRAMASVCVRLLDGACPWKHLD